jgi:hypothetical protein
MLYKLHFDAQQIQHLRIHMQSTLHVCTLHQRYCVQHVETWNRQTDKLTRSHTDVPTTQITKKHG